MSVELSDDFLISEVLIKEHQKLFFLSDKTTKLIKKSEALLRNANKDDLVEEGHLKYIFNPSRENSIDVLDFWERLLYSIA